MNTIMNLVEYKSIDFPVAIVSFSEYVQINNPNISKIPSKTLKHAYPVGVTLKLINSRGEPCSKGFDINFKNTGPISDYGYAQQSTYATIRMYMHKGLWNFSFHGFIEDQEFHKVSKMISFAREYSTHFWHE